MKKASSAPVYAALYHELAEISRKHGYALAIHGSLQRDFDVVAIPWVGAVSDPNEVIDEITTTFDLYVVGNSTVHCHGRLCFTVIIGHGQTSLDFSFMPTKETP